MKIKTSWDDKILNGISYVILGTLLLIVAYPVYFVVIASFSDPTMVANGQIVLIPRGINFNGYERVLMNATVWKGFATSIFNTVFGTLFNLALTIPLAYGLTVRKFMFKSVLMKILMITMFFGGGLIPTYMLISSLGLYNKPYSLIFIGGLSVTNVIITRTTIKSTISEEMFEAVTIDGGDHFTYFFRFVLPLSKAIIAVMTLYYGVGHWNDFMTALIYVSNADYYPLQLILRNILVMGQQLAEQAESAELALQYQQQAELMKYSLIIVTSIPIFLIYPFIQKYFAKGVMIGSLKG